MINEIWKKRQLYICNFIIEYTFETKSHTQLKTTSSARLLWTTVKIQFNTQTPYKEFEKKNKHLWTSSWKRAENRCFCYIINTIIYHLFVDHMCRIWYIWEQLQIKLWAISWLAAWSNEVKKMPGDVLWYTILTTKVKGHGILSFYS